MGEKCSLKGMNISWAGGGGAGRAAPPSTQSQEEKAVGKNEMNSPPPHTITFQIEIQGKRSVRLFCFNLLINKMGWGKEKKPPPQVGLNDRRKKERKRETHKKCMCAEWGSTKVTARSTTNWDAEYVLKETLP